MAAKKSQKVKSDEILAEGGKVPPQAVDVERYILGALLLDKEAVAVALEEIDETHFYRDTHRQIFIAMVSLYKKNEPIDLITLTEELQRQNALEAIGGAAYLAELTSMVPSAANIEYHIQIVKEKGILRQLIHACTDILRDSYDSQAEVESVLSRAQQDIFDILKSQKQKSYQGINEILNETFTELERLHHMEHTGIIGVPSGFATLDNLTAGFQKGDLVILAGRPSMGKTAFVLNIARNAAVETNVPIGVFSLEMSDMQLVQRLLCAESMVDSQRLRTGHLRENEWPKLSRCAGRLADAPIYIDDTAGLDILKLSARARRMSLERNIGLIIVDYMQLMEAPKGFDNRQQEISYISRSLKSLAKQLNVPIIALSQLSRAVEARPDRRPMLSDLRECITGDTLIYLPDAGHYIPVRELSGQSGFNILSLNASLKLEPARCLDVWETGEKDIYEVETRSGFAIRVSLNHPFYTIDGWRQLKDLEVGDFIATSRQLMHDLPENKLSDEEIALIAHMIGDGCFVDRQPIHYTSQDEASRKLVAECAEKLWNIKARIEPDRNSNGCYHVYLPSPYPLSRGNRHPFIKLLNAAGLDKSHSHQKEVPTAIFKSSKRQIALFIRQLWSTDGGVFVREGKGSSKIYYSSNSIKLIQGLKSLLLKFGIQSTIQKTQKAKYKPNYTLNITGRENILRFTQEIGIFGRKNEVLQELASRLANKGSVPNSDVIPGNIWSTIRKIRAEKGSSERTFQRALGTQYCGSTLYKSNISRNRLNRVAVLLDDKSLLFYAESDIQWERIKRIEYVGKEMTYDIHVETHHNFVANNLIIHNSGAIEQDADLVMFVYREEFYIKDRDDPKFKEVENVAEIIVGKHRNGPVGTVNLTFLKQYGKFADKARDSEGMFEQGDPF